MVRKSRRPRRRRRNWDEWQGGKIGPGEENGGLEYRS